jgi:AraC family transcriptional regulator
MSEPIASRQLSVRFGPKAPERAVATRQATHEGETRVRLLDLSVGSIDELRRSSHAKSREDFCEVFQVCLPYRGLGVWHVGGEDVIADATQVLFVRGGESYRMSGPVPGGYAELIICPDISVLSEVAQTRRNRLFGHPLFRGRSGLASPFLQSFRTRFLSWAGGAPGSAAADEGPRVDNLEAEDLVIALMRAAFREEGRRAGRCPARTARLIRRTKEFLEAELARRIRLTEVARAVGSSPAYLTDTFRRFEGVTFHRYLTQLRLARALVELEHTENLSALAFETGFSSHSHFSAAFRRTFGVTPSQFRETTRSGQRPLLPQGWPAPRVRRGSRWTAAWEPRSRVPR